MLQLIAAVAVVALALDADAAPTAGGASLQRMNGSVLSSIGGSAAPPPTSKCAWDKKVAGHYLDGWCQSLAPVGTEICGTLRNGDVDAERQLCSQ